MGLFQSHVIEYIHLRRTIKGEEEKVQDKKQEIANEAEPKQAVQEKELLERVVPSEEIISKSNWQPSLMRASDRANEIKSIWQHESDFNKSCFGAIYLCHSTNSALVNSVLKIIVESKLRCAYGITMRSHRSCERQIDFI